MASGEAVKPLALVFGEDDFAVAARSRSLYDAWCRELGGMDHETVDGHCANGSEVLTSIGKVREALNTLPFFGGAKVIWWKQCSFLGDDRTAASETVTSACAELGAELARFPWSGVRMIVSAGKVDKRRSFYKTLCKIGSAEEFSSWSEDAEWDRKAQPFAEQSIQALGKQIAPDALALLLTFVGPQRRQLQSEIEKLCLYVGTRPQVECADVEAIVTRNKQAKAFAMGEALGERNLPKLLKCLDEEMWEMQFSKEKSEFGLLAGLVSKVRSMIGVSELLRLKLLRPDPNWRAMSSQLQRIPPERLPEEKRYNPAALHPYVLWKTVEHCKHYTTDELIRAMDLLLQCNGRLIFSGLDSRLVLEQTLVMILKSATLSSGSQARRPG